MTNSYEYKRYMRDGSMKTTTAVVRSKKANKRANKTPNRS